MLIDCKAGSLSQQALSSLLHHPNITTSHMHNGSRRAAQSVMEMGSQAIRSDDPTTCSVLFSAMCQPLPRQKSLEGYLRCWILSGSCAPGLTPQPHLRTPLRRACCRHSGCHHACCHHCDCPRASTDRNCYRHAWNTTREHNIPRRGCCSCIAYERQYFHLPCRKAAPLSDMGEQRAVTATLRCSVVNRDAGIVKC